MGRRVRGSEVGGRGRWQMDGKEGERKRSGRSRTEAGDGKVEGRCSVGTDECGKIHQQVNRKNQDTNLILHKCVRTEYVLDMEWKKVS